MGERFTVINGDKSKEKTDNKQIEREQLYMKCFVSELKKLVADGKLSECKNRDRLKRAVFYAVKYYALARTERLYCKEQRTAEQIEQDFTLLSCVKILMSYLTPNEMMSIFPIKKDYESHKWECKDYFYTIDQLKEYDLNEPLGKDKLEDFLYDYVNGDLFGFGAVAMSIISDMYRAKTGRGIMEEWASKNGLETYTVNDDLGIMKNNQTGNIFKVDKRPAHLQIVK